MKANAKVKIIITANANVNVPNMNFFMKMLFKIESK